eukprot:6184122-Pleurochrysis_carterae.AAC.1
MPLAGADLTLMPPTFRNLNLTMSCLKCEGNRRLVGGNHFRSPRFPNHTISTKCQCRATFDSTMGDYRQSIKVSTFENRTSNDQERSRLALCAIRSPIA